MKTNSMRPRKFEDMFAITCLVMSSYAVMLMVFLKL